MAVPDVVAVTGPEAAMKAPPDVFIETSH